MRRALVALVLAGAAGCASPCAVSEEAVAALEAKLAQQRRATVPHPTYDTRGVAAVEDGWDAIAELVSAVRAAHRRDP